MKNSEQLHGFSNSWMFSTSMQQNNSSIDLNGRTQLRMLQLDVTEISKRRFSRQ